MSHSDEPIICPNCGSEARGNYCYQCGQETHLHKDTFWGLVMHFIGHYFHYDSKFWMTMKALWTKPGLLTQAYIDKQRMRYIPPISLYIFISAVYFLVGYTFHDHNIETKKAEKRIEKRAAKNQVNTHSGSDTTKPEYTNEEEEDTSAIVSLIDDAIAATDSQVAAKSGDKQLANKSNEQSQRLVNYLHEKSAKIKAKHHEPAAEYVLEKLKHNIPKLFFFMIPVMALMLKILYFRRKTTSFVNHAVFALHYHAFWFSLFLFTRYYINGDVSFVLWTAGLLTAFGYLVKALRNVYGSRRARAVANTLLIATGYGVVFGLAWLVTAIFLFIAA